MNAMQWGIPANEPSRSGSSRSPTVPTTAQALSPFGGRERAMKYQDVMLSRGGSGVRMGMQHSRSVSPQPHQQLHPSRPTPRRGRAHTNPAAYFPNSKSAPSSPTSPARHMFGAPNLFGGDGLGGGAPFLDFRVQKVKPISLVPEPPTIKVQIPTIETTDADHIDSDADITLESAFPAVAADATSPLATSEKAINQDVLMLPNLTTKVHLSHAPAENRARVSSPAQRAARRARSVSPSMAMGSLPPFLDDSDPSGSSSSQPSNKAKWSSSTKTPMCAVATHVFSLSDTDALRTAPPATPPQSASRLKPSSMPSSRRRSNAANEHSSTSSAHPSRRTSRASPPPDEGWGALMALPAPSRGTASLHPRNSTNSSRRESRVGEGDGREAPIRSRATSTAALVRPPLPEMPKTPPRKQMVLQGRRRSSDTTATNNALLSVSMRSTPGLRSSPSPLRGRTPIVEEEDSSDSDSDPPESPMDASKAKLRNLYSIISPKQDKTYGEMFTEIAGDSLVSGERPVMNMARLQHSLKNAQTEAEKISIIAQAYDLTANHKISRDGYVAVSCLKDMVVPNKRKGRVSLTVDDWSSVCSMVDKLKGLFNVTDHNHDGWISSEEFKITLTAALQNAEAVDAVMAKVDKSKTDVVLLEDYIAFAPFFVDLHERIVASNPLSLDNTPVTVPRRKYTLHADSIDEGELLSPLYANHSDPVSIAVTPHDD